MWLRFVVSNLLHQMAEQKLQQAASQMKQSMGRASTASSEDPDSQHEPQTCDIVAAFALNIESCGLVDRMSQVVTTRCQTFVEHVGILGEQRIAVVETGVGRPAAQQAIRDVIQLHQPRWIVSAGFAGALSDGLRRGHILMPDEIVDPHSSPLRVGFQMDQKTIESTSGFHVGSLLTVDGLIRSPEEKRALHSRFGAIACDMESMEIARACGDHGVRFLSVRVISDGLDDRLPEEIAHLLDQASLAGKFGAATRAVFKRPGSLKDMWKLHETALRAADRLSLFLTGVLPQLDARR